MLKGNNINCRQNALENENSNNNNNNNNNKNKNKNDNNEVLIIIVENLYETPHFFVYVANETHWVNPMLLHFPVNLLYQQCPISYSVCLYHLYVH